MGRRRIGDRRFWVSDNGSSLSTTYIVPASPPPLITPSTIVVNIPPPGNPTCTIPPASACGTPTGLVFNIDSVASDFLIQGVNAMGVTTKARAQFIWATEDGTIVGWNSTIGPTVATVGKAGIIAVDNSRAFSARLESGDSLGLVDARVYRH